jgi:hypothetical protein
VLIKSMAGDFELSIDRIEVEGRNLVIVGKMGVWDARSYLTAREAISVLSKMVRLKTIGFLLALPFLAMRGSSIAPTSVKSDGDNR